jgi:hypothetical protein
MYVQPKGRKNFGDSSSAHVSSLSEDWYTDPEIITLVHELYDGYPDLDPMSCHEANQTVKAKIIYTAEVDGLLHPWYGKMLWNPPWGGASSDTAKKRGMKKLLDSYAAGDVTECVCILNANAMTTAWFKPMLDFPVCIPSKRFSHYGPGGKAGSPNTGTVVIYVGPRITRFSEVFGRVGRIMVPYVQEKAE